MPDELPDEAAITLPGSPDQSGEPPRSRPRGWVLAAVIAPIAAFSALLIWGVTNAPDRGAVAGLAPDFTIQTFDHGELTLS
ncbi:MAG: hypothetical protein V3S18_02380, partial [Dehalococcoidia bacterium]